MEPRTSYSRIVTDESLRERASHGSEGYPLQYYLEDIWLFDFHCVDWHWHPEVELIWVEKGQGEFFIGSDRHLLGAGTGLFINSQVLHRFQAAESTIIPNLVFSPTLLSPEGSLIDQKYIRPVLESSTECLVFSPDTPGREELFHTMTTLFAIQAADGPCEIQTVALLLKLWGLLYEQIGKSPAASRPPASAREQAQLQLMMQYIHQNYPHPITLDDIAATVSMSKSSVRSLFHRNIHTSPIRYLVSYRLKRAARLLATTESSVCSIAQDTGFENIGYFCRKFKETFHQTPSEYRKQAAGKEQW